MSIRRYGAVLGGVAATAVVAVTSMAWACTEWTSMQPLSEPLGRPGSSVTVSASVPRGPAQVRWDGLSGPVLTTVDIEGGEFSTKVRIPDAPPGIHYVVVVGAAETGWSRAAFRIPGKVVPVASNAAGHTAGDAGRLWPVEAGQAPPSPSNPSLTAGMVLLAAGSVVMVAGVGILGVRRARVTEPRNGEG